MATCLISYEIHMEPPDADVMAYAIEHIKEDPDTTVEVLLEFKDYIFERGECVPHRTDDVFLLRFLRTRDFVVRRAHRLLVNYYEFKKKNKEFYHNVNLNCLQNVADHSIVSVMPFIDDAGRRILIYRLGCWNPQTLGFHELMQATLAVLEFGTLEPRGQIMGGLCIFDVGGLHMRQLVHLTTKFISQLLDILSVGAYVPYRIQAVHVVNESFIFDIGFSAVKPFLSKDMREKLICHGGDWVSLHKHVNPQYLPVRYGGVHLDYGTAKWLTHIKSNKQALTEMRDVGYIIDE